MALTQQELLAAASAANKVITDPALPRVIALVNKLNLIENEKAPAPVKGIGLNRIADPLEKYVWVRQNPVTGLLTLAAILALPFVVGYSMGKRKR